MPPLGASRGKWAPDIASDSNARLIAVKWGTEQAPHSHRFQANTYEQNLQPIYCQAEFHKPLAFSLHRGLGLCVALLPGQPQWPQTPDQCWINPQSARFQACCNTKLASVVLVIRLATMDTGLMSTQCQASLWGTRITLGYRSGLPQHQVSTPSFRHQASVCRHRHEACPVLSPFMHHNIPADPGPRTVPVNFKGKYWTSQNKPRFQDHSCKPRLQVGPHNLRIKANNVGIGSRPAPTHPVSRLALVASGLRRPGLSPSW